jgi:hypothetical protein
VSEFEMENSIVIITSSNPIESSFGTGFIIHRDQHGTYVLTCAHVVKDVGGPENVKARHISASLVALGSEDDIDLAVLCIDGLFDKPLLHLSSSGKTGDKFITIGFRENKKQRVTASLEGILGKKAGIDSIEHNEYLEAWNVGITDKDQLQRGNSGSPVIDKESGKVIAVISHRGGQGETGFAIAVKALKQIWHKMPVPLLKVLEPFNPQDTVPTSTDESNHNQSAAPIQGSTAELLTQEERMKLIALLCKLPNITYANVRHSLVSTLPAKLQSNNAFEKPPKIQITEIVDMVISDANYQVQDGSYPLMVLIQNAINRVKGSQIGGELQSFLDTLKDRLGVVPLIDTSSSLINRFTRILDNFILQMPASQYELRFISDSFDHYILQPDCETLGTHLTEVCATFLEFATLLKDLKAIPYLLRLRNSLIDFNRQAEVVKDDINRFCRMYGAVLEEDQPLGERQKIQKQLDDLIKFFSLVSETAKNLRSELR